MGEGNGDSEWSKRRNQKSSGKGRSWKGGDSEGRQRRMMAKGEGEGRWRRTTAKDDGEGRRKRQRTLEKFNLRWAKNKGAVRQRERVGPLEVSKNGMDEKRFETTYLVLLARPA